ncbi:adenosine deaminase [Gryllotalpicola ginsengisoli]|uniref:adenosine deaminase n=1 Tax=Gryllotalpicola ginsengisoli TaxID=444608 RepID=UPI0003B72233|nr:adenosine deaminase [Gryllotalpicola ginsengisoli]
MITLRDYLRLLPKAELHCHFVSTLEPARLIALADQYGVALPTTDPDELFDYDDLADFLVAFRAATDVLRSPADLAQTAYDGVRAAVAAGNLLYREYGVNPQYFAQRGIGYTELLDPIRDGLRAAERDLGVGYRIVIAINRRESARAAVELVERMLEHPYPDVVALGQDDLTPKGTEDPGRFAEAYALAKRHGLKTTAHAGETETASAEDVRVALDVLGVDRIDHGYRVLDDPGLVARVREERVPFATTPVSTNVLSGWPLDPDHRIARMIRAGLNVSVSTDDGVFFRTDLGREYAEALHDFGIDAEGAKAIALAGIDGAFCDEDEKARLRADFTAGFLALDAALAP